MPDVEDAIELACARLDEWKRDRSIDDERGHAFVTEMIRVCSAVPRSHIVKNDRGFDVVRGEDGQLAPRLSSALGTPSGVPIYDEDKALPTVLRAFRGDYIARQVLCDIAMDYVVSGCPLPPRLCEFVLVSLRQVGEPTKKKSRHRSV